MRKRCPVCSCRVTGFPCEVCGHDARTRPAPPKAPPDREGVPIPAGVLGQRRATAAAEQRIEQILREKGAAGEIVVPSPREQAERRYTTFRGTRLDSISIEIPIRFGPDVLDALLGSPFAPPFDHAYQGGLHRWPLDLGPEAALHGKEPCHE